MLNGCEKGCTHRQIYRQRLFDPSATFDKRMDTDELENGTEPKLPELKLGLTLDHGHVELMLGPACLGMHIK